MVFVIVNGYIIHLGFNTDQTAAFVGSKQAAALKAIFAVARQKRPYFMLKLSSVSKSVRMQKSPMRLTMQPESVGQGGQPSANSAILANGS